VPLPSDGQAMVTYTETYTYDAVGNFQTITHSTASGGWTRSYAYPAGSPPPSNQLASTTVGSTTQSYGYDANGNMTTMPQLSLTRWDWSNQLQATASQVVTNGTPPTTYYRYDKNGQRTIKATNSATGIKTSQRSYFGPYELYRQYDAQANLTSQTHSLHVTDGPRLICLFETTTARAGIPATGAPVTVSRYQLGNYLGSVVLETDENAAILTYEEYYPFGSSSFQSGSAQSEVSTKRYRFTGRERNTESGLYYHHARYYAPWLGRWTSCDPLGPVDGPNLYAYARNAPVILSDPCGTDSLGDDEKPSQVLDLLKGLGGGGKDNSGSGSGILDALGDTLKSIGEGIASAFTAAWNWVKGAASTAWNWVKGAATTAWNWTKNAATTAWNWTKKAAAWTWNWVLAPTIRTATNALVGPVIGGLAGGIPGAIIGGIAGGAMGAVHGWEMAAAGAYDWDKGAGWLEFIADNTWSLPNSFVASIFTTINAPWNPVDKALSQGQGQLVFQKSWAPDYATTFGNVTAGQQVPKHEREHAFQARLFGPIFYPSVAANYVVNIIPWWWGYHKSRYPTAPITSFKEYFTRGVYPDVWAEDWAYKIQGSPQ
jgi:RHS repeat-associated protein